MRQEALILQGNDYGNGKEKLKKFVKSVRGMRKYVTVSKTFTNGCFSAVLWPDGSKEGWITSNKVNEYREKLKAYARNNDVVFVHVRLTDDGDKAPLIEDSNVGLA